MQHEITASIIEHLRNKTGLNVVWVYDGVKLPKEKPFITVEQMQNTESIIAKLRETARTVFRFQIGLYARSASERARKQDEIKRILMFDKIELLDTTLIPASVVGYFYAIVTGVTPVSPEDVSDVTNYHKVYFDVEVDQTWRG